MAGVLVTSAMLPPRATGSSRQGSKAICHSVPMRRASLGLQGASMGRAGYKAPSQASKLSTLHGVRATAITAGPGLSRRGDPPQHSPPRSAMPLAAITPGQHKKVWQGEGRGKRQRQWQQADDMLIMLLCSNRAGRGRRRQQQWKHRGRRHVSRDNEQGQQERKKGLMEQDPSASFSNVSGSQGDQRRAPVHRPQWKQPGKAQWWSHNWRKNWKQQQQSQCNEPTHQDQAGGQSSSGQRRALFWNAKKRCWVPTLRVPAATWREARVRLRPMNMAGHRPPGMCTPHNTSQYIMDQHNPIG
ncbi:uncharacterized protein LOC114063223 [Empidonax traillii]|uniref:uncharacterized protein LOC114063223 n=1 Tax=Empidonax traillii TaxID=164674 RepID=UPI000FFD2ABF|nr:uncharacterized protein LOC114063223 [Empidonax traillii]